MVRREGDRWREGCIFLCVIPFLLQHEPKNCNSSRKEYSLVSIKNGFIILVSFVVNFCFCTLTSTFQYLHSSHNYCYFDSSHKLESKIIEAVYIIFVEVR